MKRFSFKRRIVQISFAQLRRHIANGEPEEALVHAIVILRAVLRSTNRSDKSVEKFINWFHEQFGEYISVADCLAEIDKSDALHGKQ